MSSTTSGGRSRRQPSRGAPSAGGNFRRNSTTPSNHTRPATTTHAPPSTPGLPPVDSFADLGLPEALITTLARSGVTTPFPIQSATMPDAMAGRDVLGRGRTGSGKTVAFAVPTIARLASDGQHRSACRPRALILVPTRELAAQVAEVVRPLATVVGLRTTTVYGGVSQAAQVAALRRGVDIVVATPGRLEDLIGQGQCRLEAVEVTVLDEADHMADLGFLPAVKRLLDQTRPGTQRLLFSATLDRGVDILVQRYLRDPVTHSVDSAESSPVDLEHHLFLVQQGQKASVISDLAAGQERSLLFTRTKHGARKLAKTLSAAGIPAVDLQGNLSQSVRNRNLAAFSEGTVRVLVATDIAARGIHVDEIALVVHVDPPVEHKAYLHRSGRTARAGAAGTVVTIMTPDQVKDVRAMVRKAGVNAASSEVQPGDERILQLTGPPAELRRMAVSPEPAARPARSGRPGPPRRPRPGGDRFTDASRSRSRQGDGTRGSADQPRGRREGTSTGQGRSRHPGGYGAGQASAGRSPGSRSGGRPGGR